MTFYSISNPFMQIFNLAGTGLNDGDVYFGVAGQDPVTHPITVYWDLAGTIPVSQPVPTTGGYLYRNGTPAAVYADRAYSVKVLDKNGAEIYYQANVNDAVFAFLTQLSGASGASLIGYTEGGTGSVTTTVQARLRGMVDAVVDFGCDNTGATNTTTKLQAFYTHCIATGKPGFIAAGTYKITPGVLIFDNGFVNKAWPNIYTAGYAAVVFSVDTASAADAAVLRFRNGIATGNGQYWLGGLHGGFTVNDARGSFANTHALQLTGCSAIEFGHIRIIGGGDPLNVPTATMAGNPDPYAVVKCVFAGLEALDNGGRIFTNLNGVGFTGNIINALSGTRTSLGGIYGLGSGNKFFGLGMGSCQGWAIYDPDDKVTNRNIVTVNELQNVENGIYLNDVSTCSLTKVRVVHTFNTAPNTGGDYWPRVAVSLGQGATPGLNTIDLSLIHRIDAGGTKADMGIFTQTNASGSANMSNVSIDMQILDNAGFGFADNELFTGFTSSGHCVIYREGKIIWDTRPSYYAKASSSTLSIPSGGYPNVLIFGTQISDGYGTYDPATGFFTLQYDAKIEVDLKFCLTAAVDTRARYGVQLTRSGVTAIVDESFGYAATTGAQHYPLTTTYAGSAGDQFCIVGDQDSGAPLVVTTIISPESDNRVIFRVIGAP